MNQWLEEYLPHIKQGQVVIVAGDFNSIKPPFTVLRSILKDDESTFTRERKSGRNIGKVYSHTDHTQVS